MTLFGQKSKDRVLDIPIDEISPNPMQPRLYFGEEEIASLAESIRRYGVIQPIAVRESPPLPCFPGDRTLKYEIIAGERRWRAAKLAGLDSVPCRVIDADRSDSAAMALIENIQRSDLNFFEEATAMQNLLVLTGSTQAELAKTLSVSQPTLCNKLRLLRLTERERLLVTENDFSERQVRALVRIDTERERRPVILEIIKNRLSSSETEKLIDGIVGGKTQPERKAPQPKPKRKIKCALRDLKPLYNTIDRAVKLINSGGLHAVWETEETENGAEIRIHISK